MIPSSKGSGFTYEDMPIEGGPWSRLKCQWSEENSYTRNQETADYQPGKNLEHVYAPIMNKETGEVYDDDSKKKIYAWMAANCLLRPAQITVKTIYHAFLPFSIPHTIYVTVRDGDRSRPWKIVGLCIRNLVRNILDIGRTPLYGTAMTVTSLAALIYKPTSATQLYKFRATLAHLQQGLYWGNKQDVDFLNFFQPSIKLDESSEKRNKRKLAAFTATIIELRLGETRSLETYYSPGFEPPPPR